jgi:hypothetical protein
VTAPTEKAAAGPEPANEGTGRVEVAVHECGWRRGIYILAASSCALYEKRVSRAHEFTIDDMVEPVRAGLAAATSQCVVAGSCKKDPLRVQLKEAGRHVLAGGLNTVRPNEEPGSIAGLP